MLAKTYRLLVLVIVFLPFFGSAQAQETNKLCQLHNDSVLLQDGRIHYFQVGSGRPVLLLHGLFAQKEQWTDFACQLSKAGFAAYAPDLPGYGHSTGFPIESYRLSTQADLIFNFLEKLKLQRVDIAGNSMGGAISAIVANKYPSSVKSIAFIGAPFGITGWSEQVKGAVDAGVNPFIPITIPQLALEMKLLFANPPKIDQAVQESLVMQYQKNNRHYQQVWDIVNLDITILDNAPSSSTPAFIVWGEKDGIFNISGKPLLDQKYPNRISYIAPNAGHLIMLEKPKETVDLYSRFLKNLSN
jgi:pimeloyl-ACP methyl ester carboxylesterase